jgi:GntR family transcriptional regulator
MPPRPQHTQRIVADVIAKIADGTYPPRSKLPSITAMREIYQCSAMPIKMALRELELRGYTEGHPGIGTFVAEDPPPPAAS